MSTTSAGRDFRGYGERPPHARWPGGAKLAVSVVVNVEEGAELSLSMGDERNERTYEVTDEVAGVPDPCMETHFEYGTRAGFWRVLRVLEEQGVPSTFNTCGRAVAISPWLAEEGGKRGHEISCHGWRWESHAKMSEAEERAAMDKAIAAIEKAAGMKPVGWHTRSAASAHTRRLLVERGHFLYDSDAYGDDLPYYVDVGGKPHLVLPYSFDTNDMHFHQGMQRFVSAADFAEYVIDAADWLWKEGADRPRMLSIGLHLRMIGRPGRIGGLERVLKHLRDKGGVWFARRDEIARHWLATHPPS